MRRQLPISFLSLLALALFLLSGNAQAQLVNENFDYPIGSLLTSNGWTAHSGGTTQAVDVTTGLTFTGYESSGIGGAANLDNNGQDVHKTFTGQTTGTIYASFIVQTSATNNSSYFLHFGQSTIGSTFFSRLWVNGDGTGLGIGTSVASYVDVTPNVPTLVVISYDISTKVSSLYVFDTFPSEQPATPMRTFTETANPTNVGSIALRQYSASQGIIVDGIRVATSWEDAVKASTPSAPTVTTSAATSLSATGATLNGIVNANGLSVTNSFQYGLTTSYGFVATATPPTSSGSNNTSISAVVTGLDANTLYNYRAVGTVSGAATNGSNLTFYTHALVPGAPVVSNATATSLDVLIDANGNNENTTFAIMSGGQYVQNNGTLGAAPFWQTASAWGTATVSGLASNTEYNFNVIARNSALVTTAASQTGSGTTLSASSPVLVVGTLAAFGDVCVDDSAVGSFSFSGSNLTSEAIMIGALEGYAYSLNEMGPYTSTLSIPSSETMNNQMVWVQFSPTIMGAYEGMIAISGGGTTSEYNVAASGSGVETAVMVVTGEESNVTSIQATLAGTFTMGCSDVTAFGIEYSTENNFVTGTQVAGAVENNGNFSVTVVGLEPNTVYYYKAYATDATATIYGNQMSFITQDLATPVALDGTDMTANSFVANWIAVPGATSYRIDVSTSNTFGTSAPATTTTETFEGISGTAGSYLTRTWTGVDGINWTAYKARTDQPVNDNGGSITLRNESDSYIISDVIENGISNLSFIVQRKFAGANGELTITILTGPTYSVANVLGTHAYTDDVSTYNSGALSIDGNYKIRIDNNAAARPAIDNLSFTSMPLTVPSFEIENAYAGTGTSFEVTGLDESTTYFYRVRAESANSVSESSNVIEVMTTEAEVTFGSIAVNTPVCEFEEATFTITGLIPNSTSTITYTIGAGDEMTIENIVADSEGMATFNLELIAADDDQMFTVTSIDRTDVERDVVMLTENNTVTLQVTEATMYFADNDGDGFGNPEFMIMTCEQPEGFVANDTDCDDTNPNVNPNEEEILYNGIDDNCDGTIDEGNQITTQVKASQCGTTLPNIYTSIQADSNSQASMYRFEVINATTGGVQYIESVNPWFQLTSLASHDYGTTYSISVQIQRNGIWLGYYGTACNVSTPALPAGSLSVFQCGGTLPNIYSSLNTAVVSSATQYRFRITNLTDPQDQFTVQQIDRNVPWFNLTMLASYDYGKSYQIEVAVKTTGEFSGYGSPCTVTTPVILSSAKQCGATYTNIYRPINASIIPNVSGYRFRVTNQTTASVQEIVPAQSWINFSQVVDYAPNTAYTIEIAVKTTGDYGTYGPACTINSPAAGIVAGNEPVVTSNMKVVAYPNPYSDSFALNITNSANTDVEVKVYDMIGKLLEVRSVQPADLESQRLGANYPSGVYNVIITQADTVQTLKVIKR